MTADTVTAVGGLTAETATGTAVGAGVTAETARAVETVDDGRHSDDGRDGEGGRGGDGGRGGALRHTGWRGVRRCEAWDCGSLSTPDGAQVSAMASGQAPPGFDTSACDAKSGG